MRKRPIPRLIQTASAHRFKTAWFAASMLAGASCATPAFAGGTPAGTDIQNIATATYETLGGPIEIDSNLVVIRVDELLDVTVSSSNPGDVATTPSGNNVQTFQVTNSGNGNEAFALVANVAVGGDDFDPSLQSLVLDSNNNGVYDAGVDTIYVAGSNDPVLAPDTSITVFIITSTPASAVNNNRAEVSLLASAVTGTGAPGSSFPGAGDGNSNAVVGNTGADAQASSFLAVQAALLALVKSAAVADPFGGTRPVPGSVITYTLVASVSGSGTLTNITISDPIPAETTYSAQSITLEGVGQSDAVDTDQGSFNGSAIRVAVGSLASGESRTVTFRVTIQ